MGQLLTTLTMFLNAFVRTCSFPSIPVARCQPQVACGSTSQTAADMDSLEYAAIIGIELEPVSFCGRKSVFVTKTGRTAVKSYPEHLAQPSSDHRIIGSRNHRIMGSLDHWDHGIMGSWDPGIIRSWDHQARSWRYSLNFLLNIPTSF